MAPHLREKGARNLARFWVAERDFTFALAGAVSTLAVIDVFRKQCWSLVFGLWTLVFGLRSLVFGLCFSLSVVSILELCPDSKSKTKDPSPKTQTTTDHGQQTTD